MSINKVRSGFATLHVQTRGFNRTCIALTAYVNGNVRCETEKPNIISKVEIVVQQQTLWVEPECLAAPDNPGRQFDFQFVDTNGRVTAAHTIFRRNH